MSAQPKYLRIADALRAQIDGGELEVQAPLPPERELCVAWNVSRMTIRRALGVLEHEGRVHRDATRGTFVSEPRVRVRLGSFSEEVARVGLMPGAELFWAEERPASEIVALGLGVRVGDLTYALQRLRRTDGEPMAVETTHYRADLVPGLLQEDLTGSLWTLIEGRFGITPIRTSAEVEVVVMEEPTSAQLGMRAGAGGMQLTRRTYADADVCFEYAVDVYRADRVSLLIERTIDSR